MKAFSILETTIYAADLEGIEAFYSEVIGLEFVARLSGRHVFFRCGESMLLIFNPEETVKGNREGLHVPAHGAIGPGHIAFRASHRELASWRSHLAFHGIAIERELTWPNGAHSVYFRDPAGNSVEVATPDLWGLSDSNS